MKTRNPNAEISIGREDKKSAARILRMVKRDGAANIRHALSVFDIRAELSSPALALGLMRRCQRMLTDPKIVSQLLAEGQVVWDGLTGGSAEAPEGAVLVRIPPRSVASIHAELVRAGLRRQRTTTAAVEYRGGSCDEAVRALVGRYCGEVIELRPLEAGDDEERREPPPGPEPTEATGTGEPDPTVPAPDATAPQPARVDNVADVPASGLQADAPETCEGGGGDDRLRDGAEAADPGSDRSRSEEKAESGPRYPSPRPVPAPRVRADLPVRRRAADAEEASRGESPTEPAAT